MKLGLTACRSAYPRWAAAAPGKRVSAASATWWKPSRRDNKPAGCTWARKTEEEAETGTSHPTLSLYRFTSSWFFTVLTYAGAVHDQQRVSRRHASVCVQGSVRAEGVTQSAGGTHRAQLLRLLDWGKHKTPTHNSLLTWPWKQNRHTGRLCCENLCSWWRKMLIAQTKCMLCDLHWVWVCVCVCVWYLNSVHRCQWHRRVQNRESPEAEYLGQEVKLKCYSVNDHLKDFSTSK